MKIAFQKKDLAEDDDTNIGNQSHKLDPKKQALVVVYHQKLSLRQRKLKIKQQMFGVALQTLNK